jgi:long-chain acyl-CoA synthetase
VNIAQHLEVTARRHAGRTALAAGDRHRELDEAASALAGGLAGLGLEPGERLGLHLPNCSEFVLAYYAAQKIGLVPLSLNVAYRTEEIEYILRDAAASAVITAAPVAANLPATSRTPSVRHTLDARDLESLTGRPAHALDLDRYQTAILYTSATTGRPKGVMLTAEALQGLCRQAIASYKVPETIEFVSALPKSPTGKILKKELRQQAALK